MNEALLHSSFEAAIKAYGAAGHAEAKDRLQQQFHEMDSDEITEAYLLACRLHDLAYDAADKCRDKIHSKSEAIALLKEQCPGFAERTYERAFAQGLFESR